MSYGADSEINVPCFLFKENYCSVLGERREERVLSAIVLSLLTSV